MGNTFSPPPIHPSIKFSFQHIFLVFRFVFLAIYTAEMIIKSIAKGFIINKYTYLRNPWNWLDFVVITSGYATIGMEVGNLAGLRTFRVLRALKTVSIMPGKGKSFSFISWFFFFSKIKDHLFFENFNPFFLKLSLTEIGLKTQSLIYRITTKTQKQLSSSTIKELLPRFLFI